MIVAGFSIFAPKFEFTIGERLVGILRSFCIEFRCETKIVGAASIWNVCRRDLFNFRNFTSSHDDNLIPFRILSNICLYTTVLSFYLGENSFFFFTDSND